MIDRITRDNIAIHLLEYQLSLVGKTTLDLIDSPNWRFYITITRAQHEEFKKYSINLLQKVFKFRKEKALKTFEWWHHNFGLRLKD